jgi:large subunit ribosomal protein L5
MKKHKALKQKYRQEVAPTLRKELGISNIHAVPRITKVVINMGTDDKLRNKEIKDKLIGETAIITGQKPAVQPARISVSGFGIRAGMPVGLTSTLRGDRAYFFLDKLISVVLPRLRDFRGIPRKNFDAHGNYTLGLKEHTIFPEIDLAKASTTQGLEITIVTSTKDKTHALLLLEKLGLPFEKVEVKGDNK